MNTKSISPIVATITTANVVGLNVCPVLTELVRRRSPRNYEINKQTMNMKGFFRSIFCAIAFFMSVGAKGQDKIITTHNDTVECRIVSISSTHINYEQTADGYTVGKFIPVSEVREYYTNATRQSAQYARRTDRVQYSRQRSSTFFKPWQMEARFGGSYLTASTIIAENNLSKNGIPSATVHDFYQKLRHGVHLGVNVRRLFDVFDGRVNIGIGLKYRLSSFSSRLDVMLPQSNVYYKFAVDENVYLNFWGVSYFVQHWLGQGQRFKLTYEIAWGYAYMRDELRFDEGQAVIPYDNDVLSNILSQGNALGSDVEVMFSYRHSKWLSVNVGAGYFATVFKRLTISDKYSVKSIKLDRDRYENASHLNYSAGIQFHF
jgi:hypothetical protein